MWIVTTEQAVRAKARRIADKYFRTFPYPITGDGQDPARDVLTNLIEDAFLVDPPGSTE